MCGIFTILNRSINDNIIESAKLCMNRGPEHSVTINESNYVLTFHRLAINGLNVNSNQPIYSFQ